MNYFRSFPYVDYQFPGNNIKKYKNISIRPAIVDELLQEHSNLEAYSVKEGETPETLAYDRYGDVGMHWIIMLSNNIFNLYTDWPKSTAEFEAYLKDKYRQVEDSDGVLRTLTDTQIDEYLDFVGLPESNYTSEIDLVDSDNSPKIVLRPHHFIDNNDNEYSVNTLGLTKDAFGRTIVIPNLTPVSWYEYENKLNEDKRTIYIPYDSVARRIKRELRDLLNE